MPTYDYLCKACGQEHEIFHSINEKATECPSCKESALQKLISAPAGLVFSGSGFYETDYKRKGKSETAAPTTGEIGTSTGGSCKHKSSCACH
ncbi:MAG: transcriptional regulator [Verrucomicrobia bacterium]|nr:MAG: transcriptional regulator [Verrucomicrobiota bacterium]